MIGISLLLRRFCSAWSLRAYLSWLTKDTVSGETLSQLVPAALASGVLDAQGLW